LFQELTDLLSDKKQKKKKNLVLLLLKMQNTNNKNEWINWIEDAIAKNYFKYYDYNHFSNIQEIGSGGFGKVFRANWKNSEQYLALKSFFNFDSSTIKEIVHEVIKCQYRYTVYYIYMY